MDLLTDILSTLSLQGRLYFRTELTAPWGIHVPTARNVARFHIVIRGSCSLQVDGQPAGRMLTNGDLVIIPHGAGHTLCNPQNTVVRPLAEVLAQVGYTGVGPLIYGEGGEGSTLVCGEFKFDKEAFHPLLDNLPPMLYANGRDSYNATWLQSAVGFIAHEVASEQMGALAIIGRISEIIFIQVIRMLMSASPAEIPFLAALADEQISTALQNIHKQPAIEWTVEELGHLVGMSRSVFSNHFTALVGMSPIQYVTFVRMQKAAQMLATTQDSLYLIAETVGYQSEAAFSTAFARHFNLRPGEYRRQRQGQG